MQSGSQCFRKNSQSVTCANAWWKATVKNGKWSANLPFVAFAYSSGLTVTVRAVDRAGNDAPVNPTRRYNPF